jgi:hypothetical protein
MSEILGTLLKYLVSLLGVAAVVVILYSVFGANKTQTAITDLTLLQGNTQALFSGQSAFTSVTNTVAINGGLAPKGMLVSGSTTQLQNPWGGSVTLLVNAANPARYDITETLVPSEACAKLSSSMSAALALSINGVAQTLPLDAGAAVTACNTATNTVLVTSGH